MELVNVPPLLDSRPPIRVDRDVARFAHVPPKQCPTDAAGCIPLTVVENHQLCLRQDLLEENEDALRESFHAVVVDRAIPRHAVHRFSVVVLPMEEALREDVLELEKSCSLAKREKEDWFVVSARRDHGLAFFVLVVLPDHISLSIVPVNFQHPLHRGVNDSAWRWP